MSIGFRAVSRKSSEWNAMLKEHRVNVFLLLILAILEITRLFFSSFFSFSSLAHDNMWLCNVSTTDQGKGEKKSQNKKKTKPKRRLKPGQVIFE